MTFPGTPSSNFPVYLQNFSYRKPNGFILVTIRVFKIVDSGYKNISFAYNNILYVFRNAEVHYANLDAFA